jgi:hypothetical protein
VTQEPPVDAQKARAGYVRLDVVPLDRKLESNPWALGPFCWRMASARAFAKPVPVKGKLNLFAIPTGVAKVVDAQRANAKVAARGAVATAWTDALTQPLDPRRRIEGLFESYIDGADAPNALRLATVMVTQTQSADDHVRRGRARLVAGDIRGALASVSRARVTTRVAPSHASSPSRFRRHGDRAAVMIVSSARGARASHP